MGYFVRNVKDALCDRRKYSNFPDNEFFSNKYPRIGLTTAESSEKLSFLNAGVLN